MKEITKINIISNASVNAEDITRYIKEKVFDGFFDLKVGDTIFYSTIVYIYNEEQHYCEVTGVIEKIINYLSDDEHIKVICIKADYASLSDIKHHRDYYRKMYEMLNSNDTEIVEQNEETGETVVRAKQSKIQFE